MSKSIDNLKTTDQVERVLDHMHISREELSEMVRRAAITTHERGNRRYHNWVFQIEGDTLKSMTHITETVVVHKAHSPYRMTAYEECPDCEGQGCVACGFIGEVRAEYEP